MSIFQEVVSHWLVGRIKNAAATEGREIEALNFKTPLYIPQDEYDAGVDEGYIGEGGTPTAKFKETYSSAITSFRIIKRA